MSMYAAIDDKFERAYEIDSIGLGFGEGESDELKLNK